MANHILLKFERRDPSAYIYASDTWEIYNLTLNGPIKGCS